MEGTSSISFVTDKIGQTFILNSTDSAFNENTNMLSPTSVNLCSESGVLISAVNGIKYLMQNATAPRD